MQTDTGVATIESLAGIVGAPHVRQAVGGDAIARVAPRFVVEPGSAEQVAAVLRFASEAGLGVAPRGGGTKLGWGNPPTHLDVVLSLRRLDRIIEHAWADLTVTVEAGCPIGVLQRQLGEHGQRLAVDPLWPERATVGGILSTNDSGALRLRYGGLRDLVIGVTVVLADGTIASSGGKVVKNVAGYDLPKLIAGALGTLGILTEATFRLHPEPRSATTLTIGGPDVDGAQAILAAIQDSRLAHAALQTRWARDRGPEIDVLFEGTDAGIGAQEAELRDLARGAVVSRAASGVWLAREELWLPASGAVAKLSILPQGIAGFGRALNAIAAEADADWSIVAQATGLGALWLEAPDAVMASTLAGLRAAAEQRGGSFVILRRPPSAGALDAWGEPGDAIGLMRAVKWRLDPNRTLNPGRFVGAI